MSDTVDNFVARVDRLEKRYKRDRYADAWLMPRDLMIQLRDELKEKGLWQPEPEPKPTKPLCPTTK